MTALIILGTFAGILLVLVIISLFTSTSFNYEKSRRLDASMASVWKHIHSLQAAENWNPWSAKDPDIIQSFEGTPGAVGSRYTWKSDLKNVGHGSQTIVESMEEKRVVSVLEFTKPRRGKATGITTMSGTDGAVTVTWRFESSMPRPFNVMKVFMRMDRIMGPQFNDGLDKLERLVTTDP